MQGPRRRVRCHMSCLGVLGISIASIVEPSVVRAQSSDGRFASVDDGALIPYRDTDQSTKTSYVTDDKVEKSIAPAVALFCEPFVGQGWQCAQAATERQKVPGPDDVSSYTRLLVTVNVTPPDGATEARISTLDIRMLRSCPSGAVLVNTASQELANYDPDSGIVATSCRWLPAAPTEKALGLPAVSVGTICPIPTSPLLGNPINPATLSKIEVVVDIEGPADSPLSFVRTYQSGSFPLQDNFPASAVVYPAPALMGARWRHHFDRQLVPRRYFNQALGKYVDTVYLVAEDGRETPFIPTGSGYTSELDERGHLTADGSGWAYAMPDGTVERYDAKGYLVSRRDGSGRVLTLAYQGTGDPLREQLVRVTDWQGRSITLDYDGSGRLAAVTGADGGRVSYAYDESLGTGLDADLSGVTYPDGRVVHYLYDEPAMGGTPSHKLTGIVREDGVRYATFRYDARNRAMASEHGAGLESTTLSATLGRIDRTTLDGPQDTYLFQSVYGVPRVTSRQEFFQLGTIRSDTTYLGDGRIQSQSDYLGVKALYTYDPGSGLESGRIDASGTPVARTARTTWDSRFDLPTRIDYGTSWTTYAYDDAARVIEKTEGGAADLASPSDASVRRTTRYGYDENGLLATINGPAAGTADTVRLTRYEADAPGCATSSSSCAWRRGDLHTVVDPLGLTTTFVAYDGAGRLLSSRDANGVLTERVYDPRGRLRQVVVRSQADGTPSPTDIVQTTDYNAYGQPERRTDADGVSITIAHDAAHRPVAETDGLGRRHERTLNGLGLPTGEIHRASDGTVERQIRRSYDSHGRVTGEQADNWKRTFTYDANGRLVEKKVGVPYESYVLDPLGRIATVAYSPVQIDDVNVGIQYGLMDEVRSVTDPKVLTTTYERNGVGDVLRQNSPDTGTTQNVYDDAGRLIHSVDADGRTRDTVYDASGRPLTVSYGDGQVETYRYDTAPSSCPTGEQFAKGHLASVAYADGTTSFCYDFAGRITRKTQAAQGVTLSVAYAYTPAGRLSGMTLPDGTVLRYRRDAAGDVESIERVTPAGAAATVASGIHWTSFGAVSEWTAGARHATRQYDLFGRVVAQKDSGKGGLAYTLKWNTDGVIEEVGTTGSQLSLYYDVLGHVTAAFTEAGVAQYDYDKTGNRSHVQVISPTGFEDVTYRYASDSHRLTAVDNAARTHDAAGNTTRIGTRGFVYDGRGRMTQVTVGGVVEMNYGYDPFGFRIARSIAGQATVSLHDEAGHWLGDYDQAGRPIRQIVWLDDQPMAALDGDTIRDIQADHLGTPRVVIDRATDKTIWTWPITGEVFGADPPNEDPDRDGVKYGLDMRFPGQRFDAVSGLNDNVHRDYEPATGRYVQSDPMGISAGIATYPYVGSNSLAFADPRGLDAILMVNTGTVHLTSGRYAGHAAIAIGNDSTGWTFYQEGGIAPDGRQLTTKARFSTLADMESSLTEYTGRFGAPLTYRAAYDSQEGLHTMPGQDILMRTFAEEHLNDPYSGTTNNCGDFVMKVLRGGGLQPASNTILPTIPRMMSISPDDDPRRFNPLAE